MKNTMALIVALALITGTIAAQTPLRVPRLSQAAKVSQTIGLSEVSISYHRPGVRDRVIWGNVVKYDEVWRAGANEPTLVTFSDDVMIEGKKLGAGTYRLLVIPAKTGDWTVIFNSETKNWGSIHEPKYDTLKINVTPAQGSHEEWMSFSLTDLTPTSGRIVLAWEKLRLSFKVEFNTLAKLESSVGNWQVLNAAARFALDNKLYADRAMAWVDRSLELDRNPRNLQTKAELLAAAGKTTEAIAVAEEGVKIAKAKDPKANTSALDDLVKKWKPAK